GAGWSSQEQARVRSADSDLRRALAEGNEAYERRFGHIYLACATGRSAGELLAFLRDRLGNDRATEWRVVAAELAKINRIRLRKLVGDAGTGGPPGVPCPGPTRDPPSHPSAGTRAPRAAP